MSIGFTLPVSSPVVAHLVARDEAGSVVHDERRPMYLALIDYDQATLATTDGNGEIVLKDKRLFPALYGDVDMQAVDEHGDSRGVFPLTHTMRFYLRDPDAGGSEMFLREVTRSGETIEFVWTGVAPAASAPGFGPAVKAPSGADGPPGVDFRLWPPYPNTFNRVRRYFPAASSRMPSRSFRSTPSISCPSG